MSVFLSEEIRGTMTVRQFPDCIVADQERPCLHVVERAAELQFHLPSDNSGREICLLQVLPTALCKILWVTHPEALAIVSSVLYCTDSRTIDAVLEEAGIPTLNEEWLIQLKQWIAHNENDETYTLQSSEEEDGVTDDREDEDEIGEGEEDDDDEYDPIEEDDIFYTPVSFWQAQFSSQVGSKSSTPSVLHLTTLETIPESVSASFGLILASPKVHQAEDR